MDDRVTATHTTELIIWESYIGRLSKKEIQDWTPLFGTVHWTHLSTESSEMWSEKCLLAVSNRTSRAPPLTEDELEAKGSVIRLPRMWCYLTWKKLSSSDSNHEHFTMSCSARVWHYFWPVLGEPEGSLHQVWRAYERDWSGARTEAIHQDELLSVSVWLCCSALVLVLLSCMYV